MGDAMTLARNGETWQVQTQEGPLTARQVVIALGPWSADLMQTLRL